MGEEFLDISHYYFHIVDYIVFALCIILSTAVGVFLAIKKKEPTGGEAPPPPAPTDATKKGTDYGKEMNEYLLGSRKMKVFPVAMSLVGSYISGVTILGTPPEIYRYGVTYFLIGLSIAISSLLVAYIYLPVFHTLKVASSYEYLSMRFHPIIRIIVSFVFIMDEILFLPFVIYVPALAFSQVSGVNVHILSFIITFCTVLYTLFGGMKAVVYTDAWQIYLMFFSVLIVVLIGIFTMGPGELISRLKDGGRLFLNVNFTMYEPHTVYSLIFGATFYWLSFNAVNPTMVQRYMSVSTLGNARISLLIFTIGIAFFVTMVCISGALVYGEFTHCDPQSTKLVTKGDQMLVLYVMRVVGYLRGLPGLFIAGVFGAALSSLSVILNSTALVVFEDVCKGFLKMTPSERMATIIVKSTIIILGTLSFLLVFVLNMLGGVFSAATLITGLFAGITFGFFTLGMLVPWSNTFGAVVGGVVSFIVGATITFGHQAKVTVGKVVVASLPVDVSGCSGNLTADNTPPRDMSGVFPLFRVSYLWISPVTLLTLLIVGSIASLLWRRQKVSEINADFISPIFHRLLPGSCFENSTTAKPT